MAAPWQPIAAAPCPAPEGLSPLIKLSDLIGERLAGGIATSNRDLINLAGNAFGTSQAMGGWSTKSCYEAAELAVHRHILKMAGVWRVDVGVEEAIAAASEIEQAEALMPSQTIRDSEGEDLQQFSSPAAYAYAAAWAARIGGDDVVLEPSAGTGSMAIYGTLAGAKAVHVNEIAERRRDVLRALGFEPTAENGEQVHNIFGGKLAPTRILMNPPFSRSIRTGARKAQGIDGQHVMAALNLLADGGRLVAIVGPRAMWLAELGDSYCICANVLVAGAVYQRHGTAVETRLVVVEKRPSTGSEPAGGFARNIEELIRLLAPVVASSQAADNIDAPTTAGGDSRYAAYMPRAMVAAMAQAHPGALVESHAMAAIERPMLTYRASFPGSLLDQGSLSAAQYETVCEAGQAHQQFIRGVDGSLYRRGYCIGDGTGVGKGRQVAGIIRDQWCQGRRRHVWISKDDTKLLKAARRDWSALGGEARDVFSLRTFALGEPVTRTDGIMMVSFGALRSGKEGRRRLDQILSWLGEDFEGVIAFDESHKMGAALATKAARGMTEASLTALAGEELQQRAPSARVVYVSATAASEPRNIA